ncbi:hypothetical protein [Nocardioides sp. B-3]|uniref:hypothetical protein n=1 Tax=Nocardioides sp. B-3 TaxID=2895565 RepID=UPI00215224F4|nr:hypothetical protein [Nocardioides sp. B-3]UUZ59342.1 hypothetical protein LP418_26425 [Nocardioides sp. B-3]
MPADTPVDVPEQWIAEASVRLPPGGRITGWAACRLHGANFFDGLGRDGRTGLAIPVAIGARGRIRHRAGLRVVHWPVPAQHHAVRHGLATVDEVWATADAARLAGSPVEAVVVIDMMCAAEVVSIRQLRKSGLWFAPGVLDEASEHSRSPNEVRCRLQCRFALPGVRWLVNVPVYDVSGRLLGIADLIDLEAGLVVEFDGADHREAARHTRDVVKEDALRRVGPGGGPGDRQRGRRPRPGCGADSRRARPREVRGRGRPALGGSPAGGHLARPDRGAGDLERRGPGDRLTYRTFVLFPTRICSTDVRYGVSRRCACAPRTALGRT